MENVQKTRRLFASAYGCKASRSFLIWGLSAAMFISVIPMMAEVSVGGKNIGVQIVSQTKNITGTIIDETGDRAPEGKTGFIQLENPFFDSLASQRLLTQDLGLWGTQCACGHPLPYIHYIGRATSPEGTCAAQVR